MNNGIIEQCDSPREIYEHPRTHFVADFIGNMNVLNGNVKAIDREIVTVELENAGLIRLTHAGRFDAGKSIIFCIRPERMKISLLEPKEYENSLPAVLKSKLYVGDVTLFHLELHNGKMIKVIAQNYLLQLSNEFYEIGEEVFVHWSQTSGELIYA
jgi:ABC-type Fe3+/spermidine/putrescine transport system ATPase subunit